MTTVFSACLSSLGDFIGSIIGIRAQEKMFRIYAARIVAAMKNVFVWRNWAVVEFPRDAMRKGPNSFFFIV